MNYYLAGYYLMNVVPTKRWWTPPDPIYTGSTCINDSLLDTWSYSWTSSTNEGLETAKQTFGLDDIAIAAIRRWVDRNVEQGNVGWAVLFTKLASALEYRQLFFAHLPTATLFALYVDEEAADGIRREFEPKQGFSVDGICLTLSKRRPEPTNSAEE